MSKTKMFLSAAVCFAGGVFVLWFILSTFLDRGRESLIGTIVVGGFLLLGVAVIGVAVYAMMDLYRYEMVVDKYGVKTVSWTGKRSEISLSQIKDVRKTGDFWFIVLLDGQKRMIHPALVDVPGAVAELKRSLPR